MACPVCKSDTFYVKDPDDEFETFEFRITSGALEFDDAEGETLGASLAATHEIFCSKCAWHGRKAQAD
jgi:hypothetical protein